VATGRFAGRRAVVTGASRGIGAASAVRLASEGAAVAITARTVDTHPTLPGSLRDTAERVRAVGGDAATIAADLSDDADRARVVPEAADALGGPIDILVNNAAAAMYNDLSTFTLKRRRLMFEINLHAPLDLAQAAIPSMRDRGEGWIVNVSSATAKLFTGPPFRMGFTGATTGIYGASKSALNRMTNALGAELWGTGIRVNTVEPRAAVLSEGADALVGDQLRPEQIEPMEAMVEAIVALCDCPPERTGRVHVSLDLIDELGLEVHGLDGGYIAPAEGR